MSQGVPPSKVKKQLRKKPRRGGAPVAKEVVSPSLSTNDLNTLLQQHMASVTAMMQESVQGLQREFLSSSTAHGPTGVGAGVTASVETPRT